MAYLHGGGFANSSSGIPGVTTRTSPCAMSWSSRLTIVRTLVVAQTAVSSESGGRDHRRRGDLAEDPDCNTRTFAAYVSARFGHADELTKITTREKPSETDATHEKTKVRRAAQPEKTAKSVGLRPPSANMRDFYDWMAEKFSAAVRDSSTAFGRLPANTPASDRFARSCRPPAPAEQLFT